MAVYWDELCTDTEEMTINDCLDCWWLWTNWDVGEKGEFEGFSVTGGLGEGDGKRRWLMFLGPGPVYAKFGWADGEDDG